MFGQKKVKKMLIRRKSTLTGVVREMDLPVTEKQISLWKEGVFAQHAFPDLTPDEREFIKTGITAEEWDEAFSE
jgi:hypothetical protein